MYTFNLKSFLGAVKADFHKHLVYPTNISAECDACSNYEQSGGREGGYICKPCNLYVHKDCVEINNPSRHKHPLKLLEFSYYQDVGRKCLSCEQDVERLFYHCFICDLTLCKLCPSELVIDDIPKKVHKHSLTQMMIKVSFTCDACGVCRDGLPCVCLQCCFIIHKGCIKLPRVIYINRHNHRVSHSYSLGPGAWICGVCRKGIDGFYGAYSCSVCRFAVHSNCAIREDVWDGEELEEDVSDNENQDLDPFEVIGEGLIKHFSHEHDLKLIMSGSEGNKHYCYACTLPIFFDPCYICLECPFVLHETCANLPRKIRHEIHSHQLTLCVNSKESDKDEGIIFCNACHRGCTGFFYEYEGTRIDVRCAKVSNKLNHESHTHSLFCISTEPKLCRACNKSNKPVMSCIECDYDLCFYCATLPKEVRHLYDRHPLSLCFGENAARGLYWCEICERKVNPNEWFYTCDDCCSTVHIKCVFGSYLHVRPGNIFISQEEEFEVVANDGPTRPFCSFCEARCVDPFVLKGEEDHKIYLCGYQCVTDIFSKISYYFYAYEM